MNFGFSGFQHSGEKARILRKRAASLTGASAGTCTSKLPPINKSVTSEKNQDQRRRRNRRVHPENEAYTTRKNHDQTPRRKQSRNEKPHRQNRKNNPPTSNAKSRNKTKISQIGSLETVKVNWEEKTLNKPKTSKTKPSSSKDFELIQKKVNVFMENCKALFDKRVKEGKVKDCHGDIHSGNIFMADRVYIFDAIEFNERFRYSDVAADMAFLAMDLDFKGRSDLSDFFVKKYVNTR